MKQKMFINPAIISSGLIAEPARPVMGIKVEIRLLAKHRKIESPIVEAAVTVTIFVNAKENKLVIFINFQT